jgi:hypothetical protein
MSPAEYDLDAPTAGEPGGDPAWTIRPAVLILAVCLVGIGLGALAGSAFGPAARQRFPVTAALQARDVSLEIVAPTPLADASTGNGYRLGQATVALRLRIDNPDPARIRVGSLALTGVSHQRVVLPLNATVPGQGSVAIDVTVRPECDPHLPPSTLQAVLTPTKTGQPRHVEVALPQALRSPGGLCSLVEASLPRGWRTPLLSLGSSLRGADLQIVVADLSGARIAGILVGDRLVSSAYVGNDLLASSAVLRPGHATVLRLQGPPPCVQASGLAPVPASLRLLAEGQDGLQQRLIVVGPELTRWLRLDCRG